MCASGALHTQAPPTPFFPPRVTEAPGDGGDMIGKDREGERDGKTEKDGGLRSSYHLEELIKILEEHLMERLFYLPIETFNLKEMS